MQNEKSNDTSKIQKPKVSVCIVTFNQEKYIDQCLQSILNQETSFPFEIIIGDDCSTDKTREIISKYAIEHKNIIKTLFHESNVGPTKNYKSVHNLATGEYVAHCDGDDFWLPGKIQYQVNLLEKHKDASQCWGCAKLIDDNNNYIGIFPSRLSRILNPTYITSKDIALSYALVGQHSTQMYRKSFRDKFDNKDPSLDFWYAFKLSLKGRAIYSKKIVSGYRITKSSSLTRNTSRKKFAVDVLASHLREIIENNQNYSIEAKSQLISRLFFSKIAKHETTSITNELQETIKTKYSPILVAKSAFYFLLQKIKF